MKSRIAILVLLCVIAVSGLLIYKHTGKVKLVVMPPDSLAAWYKPENKRHVWLHNMFKLRREMQAVEHYASVKDPDNLALWTNRLAEHYAKIGEMVPEWQTRLDMDAIEILKNLQQSNLYAKVPETLVELQTNCDSCHDRYRAVTAMLYRAPDFHNLENISNEELSASMVDLQQSVNQIKIASEAGDQDRAVSGLRDLQTGVDKLGGLCVSCHEHLPVEYPNETVRTAFDELEKQLQTDNKKEQGKALGMLAVTACAQCHGTHRISADTRQLLHHEPTVLELLTH